MRYVLLPIGLGFVVYAILTLSYYIFLFSFNHQGLAFVGEIMLFAIVSTLFIPVIIQVHYEEEIWKIIKITKQHWFLTIWISILCATFFIVQDSIDVLSLEFSRSGLGQLSYGSLIQAPIFEEFLFRGVILGLSIKFLDEEFAALLNGILFGLWHIGAYFKYGFILEVTLLVLTTAIFGYLLAKIQHRKGNLIIPIVLHALATIIVAITGFPINP